MGSRRNASLLVATGLLALAGSAIAIDNPIQPGLDALARGDGAAAQLALEQARVKGVSSAALRLPLIEAALMQGDFARVRTLAGKDERAARFLGLAALRQGDLLKAAPLIAKGLSQYPDLPAAHVTLARLRIAEGDRARAEAAVQAALRLDPKNAEALVLNGNLIRDQYGLKPALGWYEKALKARPGRLDALFEKAATLGDTGRSRESLAVSRELIGVSPGHAQAYYQQAVIAARAGNFDLSRRMMFRVGARLDGQPGAILLRAIGELQGGNYDGAATRFRNLLKTQSDNARIRRLLGLALWKQGQLADAIYTLGPIADRGDGYALLVIGRAYEAMGDRAAAATALDRAARAHPAMPSNATMAKLDAFLAANPGNAWAQRAAADRALSLGDASGAEALYRSLGSRLGDGDPVQMVNTAWAGMLTGSRQGSAAVAGRAYALAPMTPLVVATYGSILRQTGKVAGALPLLEKAVLLAPGEPRVAEELAAAKASLAR